MCMPLGPLFRSWGFIFTEQLDSVHKCGIFFPIHTVSNDLNMSIHRRCLTNCNICMQLNTTGLFPHSQTWKTMSMHIVGLGKKELSK